MGKIKINTGADLMYICTILFNAFILISLCVGVDATIGGKEYDIGWLSAISGFFHIGTGKLVLIILAIEIICVLIDKILLIPFFSRFTKAGKILKGEQQKKYKELKEERDNAKKN